MNELSVEKEGARKKYTEDNLMVLSDIIITHFTYDKLYTQEKKN